MTAAPEVVDLLVAFAATLRGIGVSASPDQVAMATTALAAIDIDDRQQVYWATRLTLCGGRDDFERFDAAFDLYFGAGSRAHASQARTPRPVVRIAAAACAPEDGEGEPPVEVGMAAGRIEVLRHRDIRYMSPAEREDLRRLVAAMRVPPLTRRTGRYHPAAGGPIDAGRTVRNSLAMAGYPGPLQHRRSGHRPRRLVLLIDVSASMEPYADAFLRFAHAAVHGSGNPCEVFTLGTRLTRVTHQLHRRDPDAAIAAVAMAVADAGGGTRLGSGLKDFLDRWGQRGTARGAIAVVLSDGWERGDPTLLGEGMARLHRLAHLVVWANPRMGAAGYTPTAGGMAASLPHIDALIPGHSLASLELLAASIHRGRPLKVR